MQEAVDSPSLADSVRQEIHVEERFALATARIRWQAAKGQALPLLFDPAVLTGPGSGAGRGGSFGRPTDVAFDTQGNIFVADGYTNSRVAKFTKDGDFVKSIGVFFTAGN